MKKFAKKLAAALMAGTLILGMAVTSFAAEDPSAVYVDNDTELTKTWTVADAGLFDGDGEAEFELTFTEAKPVGTYTTADPTATTKTVTLDWADAEKDGTTAAASMSYAELFAGIGFTQPGDYYFTLTENAGENPNITYDTNTTYVIEVLVGLDSDGDLSVLEVVTTSEGKEGKLEAASFENTAADNSDLTITKTVSGNAANKNDVFTFNVTVSGIDGTYSTNVDGTTITNGTTTEFTLKHGDRFVIKNLPVGATYTITEKENSAYQTTEINDEEVADRTAKGTITSGSDNVTVAYENIATVASATGLFLNFAPFVLIFAVAVAGCFVFFRSRRTW